MGPVAFQSTSPQWTVRWTGSFSPRSCRPICGAGLLLYLRGDTLMAQAIDPDSGKLRGDPTPAASLVAVVPSVSDPFFSASGNGVLAFRRGSVVAEDHLEWFDRSGKRLGTAGGVADYTNPVLSSDGERVAVGIRDPATAKRDIWILDRRRDTASRFTFDPADNFNPVWSPDGARVAFSSDRRGLRDLYVKNASGAGEDELLLSSANAKHVEEWSPDGRWILYSEVAPGDHLGSSPWRAANRRISCGRDPSKIAADFRRMANGCVPPTDRGQRNIHPAISACLRQIEDLPWRGLRSAVAGRRQGIFYGTSQDPVRIMAVDIAVKNGAIEPGIPHPLFEVRLPLGLLRNRWVVTPTARSS